MNQDKTLPPPPPPKKKDHKYQSLIKYWLKVLTHQFFIGRYPGEEVQQLVVWNGIRSTQLFGELVNTLM